MDSQTTAIVGLNASGKTRLVEQKRRQMATDSLRYVSFCDSYGTATDRAFYLQQRWNQHDISNETPYVGDLLERAYTLHGADSPERRTQQARLYDLLGMNTLLDQYIISLSSGELRKFLLAKTLMAAPQTLIIDNPFIGLDVNARRMFSDLLRQLTESRDMQLYLLLSRPDEIPSFVRRIIRTTDEERFIAPPKKTNASILLPLLQKPCPTLPSLGSPTTIDTNTDSATDHDVVVQLNDVSISYGSHTILNRISWTIHEGECWALSGSNGSGKSTLLSLICADNPQSYACDIRLFGRRRGSGESIWDIKKRIGYVSPELARSYQRSLPALHVVASGLKDTVGLYVRPTAADREQCLWWMRLLGIDGLAHRSFLTLSSGEQRMVLVARAFVKDPQLLILDEPMHGLDLEHRQLVKDVISAFCSRPQKTLIMVSHYEEELPTCITHHRHLGV